MSDQRKKIYEIYINSSETNTYALTNKVIAILFKEFRETSERSDKISVTTKKEILTSFEKVIKCIRREVLGIKNLYEKQEDNIEILVELSETLDIKAEFDNLFKVYKNICSRDIEFKVEVNSNTYKLEQERERNIPDDIKIQIDGVNEQSNLILSESHKETSSGTFYELYKESLNEELNESFIEVPTEASLESLNKVVIETLNRASNKAYIKACIKACIKKPNKVTKEPSTEEIDETTGEKSNQ